MENTEYAVIDDGGGHEVSTATEGEFTRLSVHKTQEDALAAMELAEGNRYLFLYNCGPRGCFSLYACMTHVACPKLMRIVRETDEEHGETVVLESSGNHGRWKFSLEASCGDHTDAISSVTKSGVATCLKREVDSILVGAGPKKCLRVLTQRYIQDPIRTQLLPDVEQLKNRKAQLRKTLNGGWEIKTPAKLLEWVSGRMCETRDDFFGGANASEFDESVKDAMDDLLVLRTFSHDVEMDGAQVNSFGIVFSSRKVFSNVRRAVQDQAADGILGVSDGTYKLHYGGWALVNFGTYSTRHERGVFSKHYVPWSFLFVRTEHTAAYRELFSTTLGCARLFFDVELSLAFGSLDHASCIANAFSATWPDISLLTCWPHAARKVNEKATLLRNEHYYENVISIHLQILRDARTIEQFRALAEKAVAHWQSDGEVKFVEWFSSVYLANPWGSWFMSAAGGVMGVLPSQNSLEAFHRVIKKVCISGPKMATAAVLEDSLPGVLDVAGKAAQESPILHFCEGPFGGNSQHGVLLTGLTTIRSRRHQNGEWKRSAVCAPATSATARPSASPDGCVSTSSLRWHSLAN